MSEALLPTEFWVLNRGREAARCVARPHPLGVEVRYLMNHHPLISRVFESWDAGLDQARLWREGLEARGWGVAVQRPPTYLRRRRARHSGG